MTTSNRVFVLNSDLSVAAPCHPARARELLKLRRAAVYRRQPFTIVLKERSGGAAQPIELRLDPGSRTTGLALVASFAPRGDTVVWAANLHHRGLQVRAALDARRARRRGRRSRKTRYRKPRFLNRPRPAGWLPPSLESRVHNVLTWGRRLQRAVPMTSIAVETVRFDLQKRINPEISGVEYQQGERFGYEIRQYLLEKWGRTCAYCGKCNVPLQIEHVHPRSRGGSNRVGNLTLACRPCNEKMGARSIGEFLADQPERLASIKARLTASLRDAAAVNATRLAIGAALKSLGLPVTFWSGGRTQWNRTRQGYRKEHWIDAACVGEAGAAVAIAPDLRALTIRATGRGTRQVVRIDRYGFPRGRAGRIKRAHGLQTGDLVRLVMPKGKYAGTHVGHLVGIRASGILDLDTRSGRCGATWKNFQLLQRGSGYAYAR